MARAWRRANIAGMPDPDSADLDQEPDDESRFDVHEWFETYRAEEHAELAGELVGVPFN
jgi:hypothetical protein